jgi:hypothetical protein
MPRDSRELLVRRTGAFRDIFRYVNLTSSEPAEDRAAAQGYNHDFSHWVIGRRADLPAAAVGSAAQRAIVV